MKLGALLFFLAWGANGLVKAPPADRVYRNGVVFTANAKQQLTESIAVRNGRILYVGNEKGLKPFLGTSTISIDLKGGFLMPGLIDGHMHPIEAGTRLLRCSLNYESITVEQMQQKIQACLDREPAGDANTWFEVVSWFQENMRPAGVKTSRADLDSLKTTRPIIVRSSFGHTVLANTRALELAKITASTQDPIGGKIWRDEKGKPTGLLEDAAHEVFSTLIPKPTDEQNIKAATIALDAMRRQGVTSFLDADAAEVDMASFASVRRSGGLTARGHFAPLIDAAQSADDQGVVAKVVAFAKKYDEGTLQTSPGITVRNAKLFLDGVISAPALTGNMVDPYRVNSGTTEKPNWVAGTSHGPAVYFPADALAKILTGLASNGIDPHMHADGDGAVRVGLDGIEAMRKALPNVDIRPAIAHDEIVNPADFGRYKSLNTTAVLSFQWEKPAGDTLGVKDYFGPARMKIIEPAGLLAAKGARLAFGSDWPVDALDEWFALKVAVTRTNVPGSPKEYQGRLGDDPGLSREAALRAATINAAYELHQDDTTGSLEPGKFADLIVLDRNPLKIPAEDIGNVKVLETVVGGKVVYQAPHK